MIRVILKLLLTVHCGLQQRHFHAYLIYGDRKVLVTSTRGKQNITEDIFMSLIQIQKVAVMSWLRLSKVLHLGLPVH